MRKTLLQEQLTCSVPKNGSKKQKFWKKETFLKIGHLAKAKAHAKAIALAEWLLWVKNYKCQKHAKTFNKYSSVDLCKKTARKSTKYWKNETILKITNLAKAIAHAKAIAFAKWSVSVTN